MNRFPTRVLVAAALAASLTVAACGGDDGELDVRSVDSAEVRLEVDEPVRSGSSVTWRVVVDVPEATPVTYTSGQDAEVVVTGPTGEWRWSDDRMFAQGLREGTLPAGETTFELTTEALDLPPGEYRAEARLSTRQPFRAPARTITVVPG